MMKTADQAIHDALWKYLAQKMDVYESRPMKEVGYPFADFEDFATGYLTTKGRALSQVTVNLNIWDNQDKRNNVSLVCGGLMAYCQSMTEAYNYRISARIGSSTITIKEDRTVTPSVWRGMMRLVFDIL